MRSLPQGAQDYIRVQRPYIRYRSQAEIETLPPVLQSHFAHAAAICINKSRIEIPEGTVPGRNVILHELIHHAWHHIPKHVIDRAVMQTVKDGEAIVNLAKRRKVPPELKYTTQYAASMVRHVMKFAVKQNEWRSSLKLMLMIPPSDWSKLAKVAGNKVTDEQYSVIAVYAYLAHKHGGELPEEYAQEEPVCYQAPHNLPERDAPEQRKEAVG